MRTFEQLQQSYFAPEPEPPPLTRARDQLIEVLRRENCVISGEGAIYVRGNTENNHTGYATPLRGPYVAGCLTRYQIEEGRPAPSAFQIRSAIGTLESEIRAMRHQRPR